MQRHYIPLQESPSIPLQDFFDYLVMERLVGNYTATFTVGPNPENTDRRNSLQIIIPPDPDRLLHPNERNSGRRAIQQDVRLHTHHRGYQSRYIDSRINSRLRGLGFRSERHGGHRRNGIYVLHPHPGLDIYIEGSTLPANFDRRNKFNYRTYFCPRMRTGASHTREFLLQAMALAPPRFRYRYQIMIGTDDTIRDFYAEMTEYFNLYRE